MSKQPAYLCPLLDGDLITILCTKKAPSQCRNEATEILLARVPGGLPEGYPRCPEHPASDDVRMIRLMSPLAAISIVPVEEG